MTEPVPGETPPPTQAQLDRLRAVLAPDGRLEWTHRLPGGLSCAMDVLASGPDGEARRYVLRRHTSSMLPGAASVTTTEARALALARTAGVPAPEAVWIDRDGIFDEPALVVTFIDGAPPAGSINDARRADQIAAVLGRIHSARLEDHESLERHVPGTGDDGASVPKELAAHPLGPALLERIRRLRPSLVDVEPCFVHADFHPGNTLWRNDRLVGVVDWEMAGIGDPAFDVAYCAVDIAYLGLDACARAFIDAYRSVSGRTLQNLEYWTAVALARAMPDVGNWLSAFAALDATVTANAVRKRHTELVEDLLSR